MARKRLSDLLREEAGRSLPPESDQTTSQNSSTNASGQRSPSARKNKAQSASTKASTVNPAVAATDAEPQPAESEALTTEIKNLKDLLASAHETETYLRQQVTELRTDLEGHQSHIYELQEQLDQAHHEANQHRALLEQTRHELDQAKQLILKLTQQQSKPVAAQPTAAPVVSPVTQPVVSSETSKRSPANPTPAVATVLPQVAKAELKRILQHPVPPTPPMRSLTNEEIGWVD